ncbi:MAG: ABC transporter permease [Candidatus Thorarchaeota archaeon]|nr:ABC transporter permease [Candidatus Thorarchaeota archaeon]
MFLSSRITANATELVVAFLIFSLSSGVVSGVLLYLDSSGPDVLSEMSNETLIDMQVNFRPSFYEQNQTTIEFHQNTILDTEYVSAIETISLIEINDDSIEIPEFSRSIVLGLEDTYFNTFPKSIDLAEGNLPLNESNCYIQRQRLETEELSLGDNFTISVPTTEGRLNKTFSIAGTFDSNLYTRRLTYNAEPFSYLYIILERNTLLTEFSNLTHSGDNSLSDRICVSFDKNELLTQDPSLIVTILRNVEKQIEQRILPDASVTDFSLIGVFYEYSSWITGMRIIALAFSVPSIIMGVMLIQYNSNLEANQQRRNIGALKTRGASGSQATRWVLSISIFTGVVGSIGALLTGILAAYLTGGVRELMIFDFTQMDIFGIVILPQTIVMLFLYSFTIGFLVAIPMAIRAFLMSPADAHSIIERENNATTERMSNPVYQVLAVCIAGILLIPLIDSMESFSNLSMGFAIWGFLIIILLGIFILGLTYLLARPSAKLKSLVLLRVKRKSLIAGLRVVGKSAFTFNKSEMMAVVFISLVFTAGTFSILAATTGSNHMRELFMFEVGADIVVDVKPGLENITLDMVEEIESLEGVSHASGMLKTSSRVTFPMDYNGYLYYYNQSTTLYGIQPEKWTQSAFLKSYFTYYNDPITSLEELEDSEDKVICNFKPIIGYTSDSFGQSYPIYREYLSIELLGLEGKHIMNCSIIDIMANYPGGFTRGNYGYLGYRGISYLPGEDVESPFVMLDIQYLYKYLNVSYINKIYIDLEESADYSSIMQQIGEIAPFSFEDIQSPFSEIENLLDTRAGQAVYGAYTLNVIFSILYLTSGITLVLTMKVRMMRRYFSLLRALGTQSRAVLLSVLIDSIISLIFGAIIGAIVGILLTLIVLRFPLTYLGLSTAISWDRLPLTISIPIPLLVGLVSISIGFTLVAAFLVIRRGLESNIADDIQHSE